MSGKNKARYEAVIIFDPELNDEAVDAEMQTVERYIVDNGGVVESKQVWSRMALAYPIRKKQYGTYTVFLFEGDGGVISVLERQLRISDKVLRSQVVRKGKNVPDLNLTSESSERGVVESTGEAPVVQNSPDAVDAAVVQ